MLRFYELRRPVAGWPPLPLSPLLEL